MTAEQERDVPSRSRGRVSARGLAFLVLLTQLLVVLQPCASIGRDAMMLDVGITIGTRMGVLLGIKYFVADNLGIGVDLFGITNPGFLLGIAVDAAYYPSFLGEYAYAAAGLSYMFGMRTYHYPGSAGLQRTHLLAFNVGVGVNTPTFWIPPVVESDNKNDIPTVVYLELGAGRILWKRDSLAEALGSAYASPRGPWQFPNIELGLRQGPIMPSGNG